MSDERCDEMQRRIDEAWLSRREPEAPCRDHAESCFECGRHLEVLRSVARALDAETHAPLGDERSLEIRRVAARELAASCASAVARQRVLPEGYARELLRILGWAVVPLPFALVFYVQLFRAGGAWLATFLPELAVMWAGIAFVLGAASWLALIYGSIPFVAHRRLSSEPAR